MDENTIRKVKDCFGYHGVKDFPCTILCRDVVKCRNCFRKWFRRRRKKSKEVIKEFMELNNMEYQNGKSIKLANNKTGDTDLQHSGE